MRIALDAYWWVSGPPSGRLVVIELARAWSKTFPDDDLGLAVRSRDQDAVKQAMPSVTLIPLRLFPHALAMAVELPWRLRNTDRLAITQNFAALSKNSAVFIQDVLFLSNPEWFSNVERAYLSLIGKLVRKSTTVFASSHSEAARISRFIRRAKAPTVVGLGMSTGLATAAPTRPGRLPPVNSYFLSVGRLNARKNLGRVIDAAILSSAIRPDCPLVIVGEENGLSYETDPIAQLEIDNGSVVFLGRATDSELRWLYEHSLGLLYLSLDEGFGLPPVEAAAFGIPLVLSENAVMREVNGSGPIYVDPFDVNAIAAAIDVLRAGGQRLQTHSPIREWADVVRTIRAKLAETSTESVQ
ncbi:glycosyltransferase family 1 protein [Glaciihabitans sp. dw_435]|uniref:glycosyltransferase family 4 protein n=1 Tax=Glaciihabitans sp. dw_435 TaxID=2720081 RepID=UPI001BD59F5A|nr:glycosyltransferase family 1 protein [Glaciihabitans sp. dw_435]